MFNLDDLKKKGYRQSKLRKQILEIFSIKKQPISVQDLAKELNKNNQFPNKSTIYRELFTLVKENFVTELRLLGDKKQYELKAENPYLATLICPMCEKLERVDSKEWVSNLEKSFQKNSHFKTLQRNLVFVGQCATCND